MAETGEALEVSVLAHILKSAMDEDTMGRLEDAKNDDGSAVDVTDYEKVKVWIENRFVKIQSRHASKAPIKDSDKMVYGVGPAERPEVGNAPCPGGCGGCATHHVPAGFSEVVAAPPDPWAGGGYDPWAAGAQSSTSYQNSHNFENPGGSYPGGDLDAFNKGKGKGKDGGPKPPMACYNCLGLGHPERLCPSQKGAGAAKGPTRCDCCKGYAHSAGQCTSKGGGKYSAPTPKGGGKGKGQWGKGGGKGKGGHKGISEIDYWWPGASAAVAESQWWPQPAAEPAWPPAAAWPPGLVASAAQVPAPEIPPPWLAAVGNQPKIPDWAQWGAP